MIVKDHQLRYHTMLVTWFLDVGGGGGGGGGGGACLVHAVVKVLDYGPRAALYTDQQVQSSSRHCGTGIFLVFQIALH